ncbi:MAG: VOC family protein [Chloroflexota bacterium]|nr:VOC family protein [Chloroflexota bacterium]
MSSPIENRIGQVFIPVSNMERAIAWYSRMFDLPVDQTSHGGTIYDVPMEGDTGLVLDANKPVVTNSVQPLCFFWTADIHAARDFLWANAVELVGPIQDIGSVSFLTFKDPDNNLLMVCQRNVEAARKR